MNASFVYRGLPTVVQQQGFSEFEVGLETCAHIVIKDECAVLVRAVGESSDKSAEVAISTARLAYQILCQKRFYIEARARLIDQQFKKVVRALKHLPEATKTRVSIGSLCLSERGWWWGSVGDIWLYRLSSTNVFISQNSKKQTGSGNLLSQSYQQLTPYHTEGEHEAHELFLIANKELVSTLNEKKLSKLVTSETKKQASLTDVATKIIDQAVKRRKQTYGMLLVEREIKRI